MRAVVFSSLLVIAVAVGCTATSKPSGFTESGGSGAGAGNQGGAGGSNGIGGGFTTSGSSMGTASTGSSGSDCSAAAELVYVLSTDNNLYSFAPDKKTFTHIGTLGCNVPSDVTPNSMAIDRNAVAWVNYVQSDGLGTDTAGAVYKVSTADASCEPSPSVTLPNGWYRLGMGFSSDSVGGTTETLFVSGTGSGIGLGKIDVSTKKLIAMPGAFSGDSKLVGQDAELTGTGDAKLYGFFTTDPVRVAQIDKSTAKILSDHQVPSVPMPMAWAFSFWGGAFYLYTSDGFSPSTVTRWDPSTNAVDTSYVLDTSSAGGFVIVGAGVSTCAPLTPPPK